MKLKKNMKYIKQYALACMALLMLTACPGHDDDGQTYEQEVTLPSNASEQMVTLNSLSTSIESIKNTATWLTVEQQFYSSGSPQVKLRSTDNTDQQERKCNVTITATSGEKVILTVTQQGTNSENNEGTGIDDLHGIQTDKPAYSRIR